MDIMWFGTNDGLNKYDGYNFEVFRPLKKYKLQYLRKNHPANRVRFNMATSGLPPLDGGLNYYNFRARNLL